MARRGVLVQLDDDLVDLLDSLAADLGTNRSELLRRGAHAVLEAEELASKDRQLQAGYGRRAGARRVSTPPGGTNSSSAVARNDVYWADLELGPEHGLPEACVISCDNVITIAQADLDDEPVGHLDEVTRAELDAALRYSLDIAY